MATTTSAGSFPVPEKFSFDPRDWAVWIQRFERYRELSDLKEKDEPYQVTALIYCMGEKADDIILSLALSTADLKKYKTVLEAFNTHFIGKRNVVYERAKFGLRNQEEGETIESFVTALHNLSQHCEYGQLKDELVRDRIVLGVKDKRLSEKLMLTETLTLVKAIEVAKQWEAVKRQQGDLKKEDKTRSLDVVQQKSKDQSSRKPAQTTTSTSSNQTKKSQRKVKSGKCKFCGKEHEYVKSACPAVGKTCKVCQQQNHFANCCPNRQQPKDQPGSMNNVKAAEETFVVGSINNVGPHQTTQAPARWKSDVEVNGKLINFKLDSGADVTAIPFRLFRKLWKSQQLQPPEKILTGPDGTVLSTLGMFTCQLKINTIVITEQVYVVKKLQQPLLGIRACEDLRLVVRVSNLSSSSSTNVNPIHEFPELFTGLGRLDTPYTIKLKAGAQPFAIHAPRRVPIPLLQKVKEKLDNMVQQGVIEPVDEPTEWCAPLVTVPKPNNDIRLCVDLTALNRSVEREYHPMPVIEHTLGQLAGASVFSKLDANSGFYQILLSPECRNLTTFITPFGRYRHRRLPFGISSAPEHFQKRIMEILRDIPGVVIHIDDMLIHGSSTDQHDERLRAVLQKLKSAGVTLNKDKCHFGVREVKFLGHIINAHGVRPDLGKVKAITEMPTPSNPTEVKRFLGMTNFLGRFIPHLSNFCKPLYDLTRSNHQFIWSPTQQEACDRIKRVLTSQPVLALFDISKPTILSADASSYGLGSALLQKQEDGTVKPVAYASRTMSAAEQRYAQIEKECLAITWACERFRDFLMGNQFHVETDHKPLIPILTAKSVDELSPRLQRFRIRLMRYTFSIEYVPGKTLITADALSRSPLPDVGQNELEDEVAAYVCHVMTQLPVSDQGLSDIWSAQQDDIVIRKVMKFCLSEWPSKVEPALQKYWTVRDELTVQNGLLLLNTRIVIPRKLQKDVLGRIHDGHLGITKCRARARQSCWWPGISEDIAEMVRRCLICVQERKERKEPLMPSPFPCRPWQRLAMDLFKSHGRWFLLVVDFHSRYPEVIQLTSMSTAAVVHALKTIFSRHGIPEEVLSDNGPQFHPLHTSPFQEFAREYGFLHKTSSPHYPQANGFVENGVKIVKGLLQKNQDWFMALLEYRASPLRNGYSPAELLMGRRIKTTLPMHSSQLTPNAVDQKKLLHHEDERIASQRKQYDNAHGVRTKDDFVQGEIVWIKDLRTWGTVKQAAGSPRSYVIQTSRGDFRRNSSFLTRSYANELPDREPEIGENPERPENQREEVPEEVFQPPDNQYRTRSGRVVRPPRRFIQEI